MRLIRVSANNFRSYESLEWDIPSSELHLIDGENLDTGRNNMTGKSTLIESIFYALYGYMAKWNSVKGGPADAVIRRGSSKCSVEVTLENAGKLYTIKRERPVKLTIKEDGEILNGKTSDLDARIPELIGMTADQFLTAVYISQDRKSSFFTMSEADRTALLSQISKVESINNAIEEVKKIKSNSELAIEKQKSFIEALEMTSGEIPKKIEEIKWVIEALLKEIAHSEDKNAVIKEQLSNELRALEQQGKDKYESLNTQLLEAEMAFGASLTAKTSLLRSLEVLLASKPVNNAPNIMMLIKAKEAEIRAIEDANYQSLRQEQKNLQAQTALGNIASEMEAINDGKCDHCGQDLPNHMREAHLEKLMESANKWEKMIVDVPAQIDLSPFKQELSTLMGQYHEENEKFKSASKDLSEEIAKVNSEIVTLKSNHLALKKQIELQIKSVDDDLNIADLGIGQKLAALSNNQKELISKLAAIEGQKSSLEKDLSKAKDTLQEAKAKLKMHIDSLDEALDLADLFKGFRQVSFDDLISRVSERAGELLALMTDNIYSTRIDQVSENAKGDLKMVLKPMITKGGLDVALDDLSGGARRTVMLAYDVALAESAGDSNVLLLDEALDGLDYMGKTEALRLLEEVSRNRAVLVIDHSSEIKAAFNNVIKITYKDQISTLN